MRKDVDEITRLARIIDVIARKCWRGLPALLGDAPEPTRQQLKDALFFRPSPDEDLGTKVQSSGSGEGREIAQEDTMIDDVDSVMSAFTWAELVQTVKWYKREFPDRWEMYRRYIVMSETIKSGWGREGALSRTADAFGVTDFIIRETVRDVPYKIARAVSMGYGRDNFLKAD